MAHVQGPTSFPHLLLWPKQTDFNVCFHIWPADFSILRFHRVYIPLEKQDFMKILFTSPNCIGPRPNILIHTLPLFHKIPVPKECTRFHSGLPFFKINLYH